MTEPVPNILVADKVTRRFGGLVAVNEVDFTIPEGSIVSLIGPNGAGKTTFFNVLLGIIDPTSGSVEFRGRRMITRAHRAALESLVWIAPSVLVMLIGFALEQAGLIGGFFVTVVIAIGLLTITLLLAIIRPLWYQDALRRLGIYRSAKPNEMVAAGIGRTFQNIRLFKNMTALENVLIGMHARMDANPADAFFSTPQARKEEASSDRRAQELLAYVGLRGIGNELAKNLPYGDQRRLEIARALASGPKLLLLDEPAAGMNPKETADLMRLISRLRRELNLTVLLIEHDMKLVMGISDRVTVLEAGRKISEGSPEEVRKDPRVIEAYLGEAGHMTAVAPATDTPAAGSVVLRLTDVHTYYGAIHALQGVSLDVEQGEIVTLIGANGAGKTTTLKTISGLLHPKVGTVEFEGENVSGVPPHVLVTKGIGHSPEGRRIFSRLTVYENLQMGGFTRTAAENSEQLEKVYELFPRLRERSSQKGGTLSGGEQQMLAIGRAMMTRPRLLLLDEPSLGLAPILVQQIFEIIREINSRGITILLVEQNAIQALAIANRGYVLQTGEVVLSGSAQDLRENETVRKAYLGED